MTFTAFSYCLDAAGDLIRLEEGKAPSCLIKGAVECVTTAHELKHPYPWTKTVAEALAEVRFLPENLVAGTIAEPFYKSGNISTVDFVFVPPVNDYASDEQVEQLIELIDQLPVGSDESHQLIAALASVGIHPIPLISKESPALVTGTPKADASYKKQGWVSHDKVYRKACW